MISMFVLCSIYVHLYIVMDIQGFQLSNCNLNEIPLYRNIEKTMFFLIYDFFYNLKSFNRFIKKVVKCTGKVVYIFKSAVNPFKKSGKFKYLSINSSFEGF